MTTTMKNTTNTTTTTSTTLPAGAKTAELAQLYDFFTRLASGDKTLYTNSRSRSGSDASQASTTSSLASSVSSLQSCVSSSSASSASEDEDSPPTTPATSPEASPVRTPNLPEPQVANAADTYRSAGEQAQEEAKPREELDRGRTLGRPRKMAAIADSGHRRVTLPISRPEVYQQYRETTGPSADAAAADTDVDDSGSDEEEDSDEDEDEDKHQFTFKLKLYDRYDDADEFRDMVMRVLEDSKSQFKPLPEDVKATRMGGRERSKSVVENGCSGSVEAELRRVAAERTLKRQRCFGQRRSLGRLEEVEEMLAEAMLHKTMAARSSDLHHINMKLGRLPSSPGMIESGNGESKPPMVHGTGDPPGRGSGAPGADGCDAVGPFGKLSLYDDLPTKTESARDRKTNTATEADAARATPTRRLKRRLSTDLGL